MEEELDVSALIGNFDQALSSLESWKKERAERIEQQQKELAARASREEKAEDEAASTTERCVEKTTLGLQESTRLALDKAKMSAASLQAVVSATSPRYSQGGSDSGSFNDSASRAKGGQQLVIGSENLRGKDNKQVQDLVQDIKSLSSSSAATVDSAPAVKLASDIHRLRAEQYATELERDVAQRVASYESKYAEDASDAPAEAATAGAGGSAEVVLDNEIGDKLLAFSSDLDAALAKMDMWDDDR